jgi:hypothetical protein
VKGGKRISWVKWSVVCKDKKQGGLGVRDITSKFKSFGEVAVEVVSTGEIYLYGRRF